MHGTFSNLIQILIVLIKLPYSTFPYQIRTIKPFSSLKRIAVIEIGSPHVLVSFVSGFECSECISKSLSYL